MSAERVHRALDGAERIAQLVREHGEEFVLRAVLALRARQRADVAQDQRAMLDVVEHDARQRHLHLGAIPGRRARGASGSGRSRARAWRAGFRPRRRGRNLPIDAPNTCSSGALHQVGEALVAVDDVAGHRERGRAFLHALDQRAVRRVGAAQREHAPLAVFVGQQQRVDLAAVDGVQVALGLEQARAQFFDARGRRCSCRHLCSAVRGPRSSRVAVRHVADDAAHRARALS